MYNDFDEREQRIAEAWDRKKKQQKKTLLLLLLLGAGAYFYFMVYLPEEKQKQEVEKYNRLWKRIINAKSEEEVNKLNDEIEKLDDDLLPNENKKQRLKEAQIHQKKQWQKTPEELENELFLKGRIWSLPIRSWADRELRKSASFLVKAYNNETDMFPEGDKDENFYFTRSASYDIYFPPFLKAHYEAGKEVEDNCELLEKNEDLILSKEIQAWYNRTKADPTRGKPDPTTKRDNNALFYGAPGTGKSATLKKLCIEANRCPLATIKGSSLTPTKHDYDAGFGPLHKFIYTISSLEWTLVKNYALPRKENGEVHYILFVDEADQTSNNMLVHDPNRLRFLKDCLEGGETSRNKESQNLWIPTTLYIYF